MSTRMTGNLAHENGKAWIGFRVSLRGPRGLFGNQIGSDHTNPVGCFELRYPEDGSEVGYHRMLELAVQDTAGRVLFFRLNE
jgi:hypothetical protein